MVRLTSSKSELGIIPQLQQLLLRLKLHQSRNRPKRLLLVHQQASLGRDVPDDGRRVEHGSQVGKGVSSQEDLSAVGDGVLDVLVDFRERSAVDERTVGGGGGEGGADGKGGDWRVTKGGMEGDVRMR